MLCWKWLTLFLLVPFSKVVEMMSEEKLDKLLSVMFVMKKRTNSHDLSKFST